MKLKKIYTILIIFALILIPNISKAYTISIDDIKAKKGEEFTVNLNVDTETPLANGKIIFDSSKIEFVKANQEFMNVSNKEDGKLAWIYVNLKNEGIKNFEFTFKIKENGASEMKFEDLEFVDKNGNEYYKEKVLGNRIININKNINLSIIIMIIVVIILSGFIVIILNKRKNRK